MALITIRIERPVRTAASTARPHGRRGRLAVLAGVAVLAGGTLVGASAARAGVISVPPKTLASAVTVAAHGTYAVTAIGGTTPVPTDATRVVLDATVTNPTANGTLAAYPNGGTGAGADTLPFTAGHTKDGTFTERIGTHNMVRFRDNSSTAITLTITVVGYSTDVDASDVTATGGSAGQVLTNTGTGAAWQSVGHAYGVANRFGVVPLTTSVTTVASVTVPAGSYVVTFDTTIAGSSSTTPDNVACFLFSPDGTDLTQMYGNTGATDSQSVIAGQGLVSNTVGGTITLGCVDSDSSASAYYPSLIANSVGSVTDGGGAVAPNGARPRSASVH
jgi:hypothetical protein